jgi:predicted acylesterase/phospholipase RssA
MSETKPAPRTKDENGRLARLFLSGEKLTGVNPSELADQLREQEQFAYAAEVYFRILNTSNSITDRKKTLQHLAFCLYKDPDLPASIKFDQALKHLREVDDWDANDSEVLGKLGAAFKHSWYQNNRFEQLLYAEHFYRCGYKNWEKQKSDFLRDVEQPDKAATPSEGLTQTDISTSEKAPPEDKDAGYNALNYAYILDLMAYVWRNMRMTYSSSLNLRIDQLDEEDRDLAEKWEKTAREVRLQLLQYLPKLDEAIRKHNEKYPGEKPRKLGTWIHATYAESYFCTEQFDEAKKHYLLYHKDHPHPWQITGASRQMLSYAEFKVGGIKRSDGPQSEIVKWQTHSRNCYIAMMAGDQSSDDFPTRSITRGKVGLALSGGGFRASLFDIGVLAALAELDVLRHVEVLSCVSGGSIAGAYYYLLLQERLEKKRDQIAQSNPTQQIVNPDTLTTADYIEIVQEMSREFLKGVQSNIRMKILEDPYHNYKIFFNKRYTRTNRLAELYESELFARTQRAPLTNPANDPFLMHNLKIRPQNVPFNPKTDNWKRHFKIPMLVLNATSLNTGHNWQFTASWMGEPPGNIRPDVDSKPRLRRMYYQDAPAPEYRNNVRLGTAVGASSCVPALFTPLHLPDLYDGYEVYLVDGGVHDNQGIASLLEQECKIMIISDASGQMNAQKIADDDVLGTIARADTILQDRVREAQYLDIKARKASGQLTALSILHLTKDLQANPIKWRHCEEPTRQQWLAAQDDDNTLRTTYGILQTVQTKLAGIRTDLDAFSDAEAYALMYSGYRQMYNDFIEQELEAYFPADKAIGQPKKDEKRWDFMPIEPYMTNVEMSQYLLPRLELGQMMAMRNFKLMPMLRYLIYSIFGVLILCALYAFYVNWNKQFAIISVSGIGIYLVLNMFARIGGPFASKVVGYKTIVSKLGAAFILALLVKIYLRFIGPRYLEYGKLEQLKKVKKTSKWVRWWNDYLN